MGQDISGKMTPITESGSAKVFGARPPQHSDVPKTPPTPIPASGDAYDYQRMPKSPIAFDPQVHTSEISLEEKRTQETQPAPLAVEHSAQQETPHIEPTVPKSEASTELVASSETVAEETAS